MKKDKTLLILFDGHALIHRGFHALPGLSTKDGKPTGAVFGFTSMLLKVLADYRPEYCAVTFDSAAPTFRHTEFAEYKAHRPKAPDELISQFQIVRDVVKTLNIPSFEVDGYEADDILGTLSRQADKLELDTVIVTGDSDLLQLVSPSISVLLPLPRKPFSETQLYDEQAVNEKYGLKPAQITDLKGLVGDTSDNIPGVPGIGQKTAAKLLLEYHTIEDIYQQIATVRPAKLQQKLRDHEELARQSKRLATITTDAPIDLNLPACTVKDYNRDQVVDTFRNLEFFSLLNKLPNTSTENHSTFSISQEVRQYSVVDTGDKLDQLIEQISEAEIIAIDTETTSRSARQASLVGISISVTPGKAYYIPVGHTTSENQLSLSEIMGKLPSSLLRNNKTITAHNSKYDTTVLLRHGFDIPEPNFDTMIAAYLLGDKSLGLKQLSFGRLGLEMTSITELIGSGSKQLSMSDIGIEKVTDYACADADMTLRLCQLMGPELKNDGLWELFSEIEMPLVPILRSMEETGVTVDIELLTNMSVELGNNIKDIETQIYTWVGREFNLNSNQQLGKVLFEELKLPPSKKTKTGYSTDAAVLEGLKGIHPVINFLLEYRQLTKLKSTYVDSLPGLVDPETGRIHTSFNQTVTATGRLSSSDPNLQNIPVRTDVGRNIRKAFVAPADDHILLAADYSQIELRVLAYLSQDPGLLQAFANDEDIHTATAAQVFNVSPGEVTSEKRRIAKVINFGVVYGMSDYGLQQATRLSRKEAADFIEAYFSKYEKIGKYLDSTKQMAIEKGYVQTALKRRRYVPEIKSSNYQVRQAAERMAINMPVQGTAADIIKLAMIQVKREMDQSGMKSKMILQVHDELIFEVPVSEADSMQSLLNQTMPKAMDIGIPLKVDMKSGKNWGGIE